MKGHVVSTVHDDTTHKQRSGSHDRQRYNLYACLCERRTCCCATVSLWLPSEKSVMFAMQACPVRVDSNRVKSCITRKHSCEGGEHSACAKAASLSTVFDLLIPRWPSSSTDVHSVACRDSVATADTQAVSHRLMLPSPISNPALMSLTLVKAHAVCTSAIDDGTCGAK